MDNFVISRKLKAVLQGSNVSQASKQLIIN
jgi:hypothetical protein